MYDSETISALLSVLPVVPKSSAGRRVSDGTAGFFARVFRVQARAMHVGLAFGDSLRAARLRQILHVSPLEIPDTCYKKREKSKQRRQQQHFKSNKSDEG